MMRGLVVGRTLDRYQIERPLGQGGMATVVAVRHTVLGTLHAMKVLHLSTPRLVDRFLREGRVQAAIRHPNLVAVTDVVTLEHGVALILEYVDGPTLADLLRIFTPTFAEIDALAEQIMAGVASAHERGIVHRDLKPANVLIARAPEGLVAKVTDFGLARALVDGLGGAGVRTHSGVAMGTPGYMAPEQHRNARDVDARADVFSLGALLYELVTGQTTFQGQDLVSAYEQIIARRYLPVEVAVPDAPARMAVAIAAALEPNPADRPRDVATLRALWFDGEPDRSPDWEPDHLGAVDDWIRSRAARAALPPTYSGNSPSQSSHEPSPTIPVSFPLLTALHPAQERAHPPEEDRPFALALMLSGLALVAIVGSSAGPLQFGKEELPAPVVAAPPDDPPPAAPEAAAGVDALEAPAVAVPSPPGPEMPKRAGRTARAVLTVNGVENAILIGADEVRHRSGEAVPPGEYRLMIQDASGEYIRVLNRTLRPGEHATVVCVPGLVTCK